MNLTPTEPRLGATIAEGHALIAAMAMIGATGRLFAEPQPSSTQGVLLIPEKSDPRDANDITLSDTNRDVDVSGNELSPIDSAGTMYLHCFVRETGRFETVGPLLRNLKGQRNAGIALRDLASAIFPNGDETRRAFNAIIEMPEAMAAVKARLAAALSVTK